MEVFPMIQTNRRDFLGKISGATAFASWVTTFGPKKAATLSQSSPTTARGSALQLSALRAEFPLLSKQINGHPLAYLDSAATTQRPRAVIDALASFYVQDNANPAPSLHALARRSASVYEEARTRVARFLNASGPEEIVWTRGTTEALNLVASSWGGANLQPGDEILLTVSEHYSNLVPWQLAARRANGHLRVVDVEDDGGLRLDQLGSLLSKRTKVVTLPHASNVLGSINPVREICERAHCLGAVVVVDGAQSIPHFAVDVQALGCDFFAFSGHKMLGPMGVGVLWARREILENMRPYQAGSNMVHDIEIDSLPSKFAAGGLKFEAGTPNVPGAVGLAAAIEFLESLGREELWSREQELTRYALSEFAKVKDLRIVGSTHPENRISVFSFVMGNKQPVDVAKTLDALGIAVRAGDLASRPLLMRMGVTAAVRVSCYAYTTGEEIDRLVAALRELAP
jgi:cysteine desulfurase / selenocysteine lyase